MSASPPLRCAAFSPALKLLSLLILVGSASWMYQLWHSGKLTPNLHWALSNGWLWVLAAWLLMLYTVIAIYRSSTILTDDTLKQQWIWDKEVALKDIAYAKLIRIKGLDWLIAPRLYVRTGIGKFSVFYAADEAMLARWEKIARKAH